METKEWSEKVKDGLFWGFGLGVLCWAVIYGLVSLL